MPPPGLAARDLQHDFIGRNINTIWQLSRLLHSASFTPHGHSPEEFFASEIRYLAIEMELIPQNKSQITIMGATTPISNQMIKYQASFVRKLLIHLCNRSPTLSLHSTMAAIHYSLISREMHEIVRRDSWPSENRGVMVVFCIVGVVVIGLIALYVQKKLAARREAKPAA